MAAKKAAKKAPKKAAKKAPKKAAKAAKKKSNKKVQLSPKKAPKSRAKAPPKSKSKGAQKPRRMSNEKWEMLQTFAKAKRKYKPTKEELADTHQIKERLRASLNAVCAYVDGGCNGVRIHAFKTGIIDAELRIGAPTKPHLRERLLEIEEGMAAQVWPVNSWISIGFIGHLDPSRTPGGYAKRLGQETVECYPQRRNRMGAHFVTARGIAKSLYQRQRVTEIVVRVHVGSERPNRRFAK